MVDRAFVSRALISIVFLLATISLFLFPPLIRRRFARVLSGFFFSQSDSRKREHLLFSFLSFSLSFLFAADGPIARQGSRQGLSVNSVYTSVRKIISVSACE